MFSALRSIAARGWVVPLSGMARRLPGYYQVIFLGTGLRTGILQRLGEHPATAAELGTVMGYDPELTDGLAAWLDLGVTIGLLGRRGSRYRLRSTARALVRPGNDPIAAFYDELSGLEHRLICETPDRLATGQRFAIVDADPGLIARSSRMSEPWLDAAIEAAVPRVGPVRLLEIGCGSGVLMRSAARLNPELTAVGVELQEPAAEQARANLARWGLAGRTSVEVGDIRRRQPQADVDLVTLHQNIYYFPESEQVALFAHLREFLRPGGALLVTTIVRDSGVGAAGLDLWGAMTEGAGRLPVPSRLVERMRAAGLVDVEARKLSPDGMYAAFIGRRP